MTIVYTGSPFSDFYDHLLNTPLLAYGNNGNDTIYGNNFNDDIYGNAGNDVLDGWNGHDYLDGGKGNDALYGWNGNDVLNGGAGNDSLYGEVGRDYLVGGVGNDVLQGSSNPYPNSDYDTLIGGAGYDLFVLGKAGQGNFYLGNGYATIVDFNSVYDTIQVSPSLGFNVQFCNLSGSFALDTLIYTATGNLLGVVQDNINVFLGDIVAA